MVVGAPSSFDNGSLPRTLSVTGSSRAGARENPRARTPSGPAEPAVRGQETTSPALDTGKVGGFQPAGEPERRR